MAREFGVLGTNSFEHSFLMEVSNDGTGNRSVNLELFAKDSSSDDENFGNFVAEFIVSLFVKEDIVVKLILDLNLGP